MIMLAFILISEPVFGWMMIMNYAVIVLNYQMIQLLNDLKIDYHASIFKTWAYGHR